MDFEHRDEFDAVREAAYANLRSGVFTGRHSGLPLCRLLIRPSFENAVGWDVLSLPVPGKPDQVRLFRSCWRMDLDLPALRSPVERFKHPRAYRPTVEMDSTPIDAVKIDGLIRRLQSIPIPIGGRRKSPIGRDGTNYELELGHFFCYARISWWERLPGEWKALGPVVHEMIALFETSWRDG